MQGQESRTSSLRLSAHPCRVWRRSRLAGRPAASSPPGDLHQRPLHRWWWPRKPSVPCSRERGRWASLYGPHPWYGDIAEFARSGHWRRNWRAFLCSLLRSRPLCRSVAEERCWGFESRTAQRQHEIALRGTSWTQIVPPSGSISRFWYDRWLTPHIDRQGLILAAVNSYSGIGMNSDYYYYYCYTRYIGTNNNNSNNW